MQWNHNLALALLGRDWLGGERLKALACAEALPAGRFHVKGLDAHGIPVARSTGAATWSDDDIAAGRGAAVHARQPESLGVRLYRAVQAPEACWLALGVARIAVIRIRDTAVRAEPIVSPTAQRLVRQRSVGKVLRGVGRLMRDVASGLQEDIGRPPLHERPEDAVLEFEFEAPRTELLRVERCRQLAVGPATRQVRLHFTDDSWARIRTDVDGAEALTLPY
ncbi:MULTISPECIES: hypothetical protein [unclassified Crossiella]|uniref:hypothetical protein n=1 Tax=unclassified Crossiella TaxID=2620835 RepID=UPI001FFFF07C|nr:MULTISPECIES: hypothetical protein [unclassified Crossiella]MCK2242752.1 hypothetical protein [Crossiella sp. S99.2]MCK2256629.1 hypothetical protein [Crossiella sp. S99.1]